MNTKEASIKFKMTQKDIQKCFRENMILCAYKEKIK